MITWIYALGKVTGAIAIFIGCILCLLLAFIVTLSFRENRVCRLTCTVLAVLTPAALCDILWFFLYFPSGTYQNTGLASSVRLLLYPLSLAVSVCTVTLFHKKRNWR